MRLLSTFILLFAPASVFGDCLCSALSKGVYFFENTARDANHCKSLIATEAMNAFEQNRVCANDQELNLSWSCSQETSSDEKTDRIVKVFKCQELASLSNAGLLLEAVSYASVLTAQSGLEPKIKNDLCAATSSPGYNVPRSAPSLTLKLENKEDTKEVLKRILPERDDAEVGDIFDLVHNGRVSFFIHNDNSLMDLGEGGESDDMGFTHGFNLIIEKNLLDEYRIKFEYETNLYTNFADPAGDHGFWRDDDGNWHVSQNYIEENLGKVILEKQKSGDAFYWNVGGGIHNLNKGDGDGALGVLSALGSQAYFHETAANVSPGSARLYDNKGQEGGGTSLFMESGIGKRHTFFRDPSKRIFIETQGTARLTGVDGASYISARASANYDQKISESTKVRFSAGRETKVYSDRQDSSKSFSTQYIDIKVGNETLQGGFLYEFKDGRAPAYQNALAQNYVDRDLFAAKEENIWTIYVKYTWE